MITFLDQWLHKIIIIITIIIIIIDEEKSERVRERESESVCSCVIERDCVIIYLYIEREVTGSDDEGIGVYLFK